MDLNSFAILFGAIAIAVAFKWVNTCLIRKQICRSRKSGQYRKKDD
jgi:hypothetical protein